MPQTNNEHPRPSIPADATFVPGRVGIMGLGLMGGSFAKALHAGGREVFAYNRTHATLELAMIECVDAELDEQTVGTCELIVLAGYPQASIDWLTTIADKVSPGAIVIDVVGVKQKWRCLAQAFIRITKFTSQKRYIHEKRSIREVGKMINIERIMQTEIPDIAQTLPYVPIGCLMQPSKGNFSI